MQARSQKAGGCLNRTGLLVDEQSRPRLSSSWGCPSTELVAAAQLSLVGAHLASSDLDAAQELLPRVLELPAERRTVPVVDRTAKIGGVLARPELAESAQSRELRERIALFVAYPATQALAA